MRSSKRYSNASFTKRVDHLAGRHHGPKTPAGPQVCESCGAVFIRRHWIVGGTLRARAMTRTAPIVRTTCEACRMVADGTFRGELRVSGAFYGEHHDDIEHLLRNEVARGLADNPQARIVRWTPRGSEELTVTTTTEHLAQKLGRALKKAFSGAVHFEFSHENKFAHVTWRR
jgi:NMD protein affecting ribosome stability and mRNA decay